MKYAAFALIFSWVYLVSHLACSAQERIKGLYNVEAAKPNGCCDIASGKIYFEGSSADIGTGAEAELKKLATEMMLSPSCRVVVLGYGHENETEQQLSWERTRATIDYLTQKLDIDSRRFIFQYGFPGMSNTVVYRLALPGEEPVVCIPPKPKMKSD